MDGERQQLLSLTKSKEAKMQTITKRLRGVSRYIVGLGLLLGVVVVSPAWSLPLRHHTTSLWTDLWCPYRTGQAN